MFSLLWRFFPGPVWLRVLAIIVAVAVLVYALIVFVYPWVTTMLPAPESVVNS